MIAANTGWRWHRRGVVLAGASAALCLGMAVGLTAGSDSRLSIALVCLAAAPAVIPVTAGRPSVWFAVFAAVAFLLTRPNMLGEVFGFVGIALWLVMALLGDQRRVSADVRRGLLVVGMLVTLYWAYVGALTIQRGGSLRIAIPSLLACLGAIAAGLAFAQYRSRTRVFQAVLVGLCTWQIAAYFVAVIGWRAGASVGHITDFTFESAGGRPWTYSLWWSGAITVDGPNLLPQLGPRLTGWAGEPGILAAVFAFVGVTYRGRGRLLVIGAMGIGIIGAQSTAGILIYAVALLVSLAVSRRSTAGLIVGTIAATLGGLVLLPLVLRGSLGLQA